MNENRATSREEGRSQPSLKRSFFSLKTLLSFILSFTILYLLVTRVDFKAIKVIIGRIDRSLMLLAFFIFYSSIFLRGLRWHRLLQNIGFYGRKTEVIEILFISWFANVIVPAKLGDIYRSYLMHRNYAFSMSKTVGSVFTERVFDMLVLFILFVLTGLSTFGSSPDANVQYLLLSGLAMTSVLIATLILMKYFGKRIGSHLPSRIKEIYERFETGTIESIKKVPLLIFYTIAIWLMEAGRLYFVTLSLQVTIPIILVLFIALASSLLTALPITPAGLGAVEVAIVGILVLFGIDKNIAISIAIVDRLISYWSVIPLGYFTFVFSKKC